MASLPESKQEAQPVRPCPSECMGAAMVAILGPSQSCCMQHGYLTRHSVYYDSPGPSQQDVVSREVVVLSGHRLNAVTHASYAVVLNDPKGPSTQSNHKFDHDSFYKIICRTRRDAMGSN